MLSNLKKPSALLVVERMTPVETFFAAIEAPGTAASPGSVTVPCKVAVVVWAKTQPHKSTGTQSTCAIRFNDMIKPPNLNAKTRGSPRSRSDAGTAYPPREQEAGSKALTGPLWESIATFSGPPGQSLARSNIVSWPGHSSKVVAVSGY